MIDVPIELYDYLKSKYNLTDQTLCDLHKPCESNRQCDEEQKDTAIINFDKVMSSYCSNNKQKTMSSVDGLTCNSNSIIFIEIKGWKEYLKYAKNLKKEKIQKQVDTYNFGGKLIESMAVCVKESENNDFFKPINVAYIIVTDINNNDLDNFAFNLNALAGTTSSLENTCNEVLKKKVYSKTLEDEIKNMSESRNMAFSYKIYYKSCVEFDEFVEKL